jgi:hypothetical protein
MKGGCSCDSERAGAGRLAHTQLLDLAKAKTPQPRCTACGNDQPALQAETAQREQVEMVIVQVRNEYGVDILQGLGRELQRKATAQKEDTIAKDRVSEDADAFLLN